MADIFDKSKLPHGRCNPCQYARVVVGSGQWPFLGCFCPPYRGKWVAEIKDCPNCGADMRGAENDGA